jgi:hypothetical protein
MNDFVSLTELGTLFGVSSHAVGKWLIECGLRTDEMKPSSKAFDGGYVKQAPTGRNDGYFYVWHQRKTLEALKAAGHRPKPQYELPGENRLKGPFEARCGTGGYEIVDDNGLTVRVSGKRNADDLMRLMNLAFKHGQFGR